MNQVLHIFRKDTRRFWPEIVVFFVVLVLFVIVEPNVWHSPELVAGLGEVGLMVGSFLLLIPAAWWLLVARAVQDESLVGDRQFWITRPYRWPSLLGAKILFVLAWLGAPYFVAQLILLHVAGFSAIEHAAGAAGLTLLLVAALTLPALALAALTSNLVRLVLTALACLVALVGLFALVGGLRNTEAATHFAAHVPDQNWLGWVILIGGCMAILILQYATRRAWLSRGLLVGVPILMFGSGILYSSQLLADHAYAVPPPSAAPAFTAESASDTDRQVMAREWKKHVFVDVPVRYSGTEESYAAVAENMRFTLKGADGSQWTSPWQAMRERLRTGQTVSRLSLQLTPELYEQFKAGPMTLHVEFEVSQYQAESSSTVEYPLTDVAVPGIGFCTQDFTGLFCRSAVKDAPLAFVTGEWRNAPCAAPPSKWDRTLPGSGWLTPISQGFQLLAVRSNMAPLGGRSDGQWYMCPGSPMSFTEYRLVGRTRAEMTVLNFQIPQQPEVMDDSLRGRERR